MAKEKRTFNSEVLSPASLRLQKSEPAPQKPLDPNMQPVAPREFFAPELLNRLVDKIKKL